MDYWLGIDLGTTYTAAALATDDGGAEMLVLGHDTVAMPSVVAVSAGQEATVGVTALRAARADPLGIAREFKRRFGDSTPILIDGRPYTPQQLMVHLIKWIVALASTERGEAPAGIAITHPANWGPYKIELLGDVITLAELTNPTIIAEPTAAAWWYGAQGRIGVGDTIGVFDFGGGTFDAVVLHRDPEGFNVVGRPSGIDHLGGMDLDDAVVRFALDASGLELDSLDRTDPQIRRQIADLRDNCRLAKEDLSSDTTTQILVAVGGVEHSVRLTRAEFEDLARPVIDATVGAFEEATDQAGLTTADLTTVLLVGGSSRVPLVAQMVGYATGRPVTADVQSKNCIALGAALIARDGLEGHDDQTGPSAKNNETPIAQSRVPDPPPSAPLSVTTRTNAKRRIGLSAVVGLFLVSLVAVSLVAAAFVIRARTTDNDAAVPPSVAPTTSTLATRSETVTTVRAEPPTSGAVPQPSVDSTPIDESAAPRRFDGWVSGALADPLRSRDWGSAGPTEAPMSLWRTEETLAAGSAPVVADGVVYATFADSTLRALDLLTGELLWSRETRFGRGTPTVSEDAVFFLDRGRVVAVDRETGSIELVRVERPTDVDASLGAGDPTVVDGVVYVTYQRQIISNLDDWAIHLVATDLNTGRVRWQWSGGADDAALPVMITEDAAVLVAGTWAISLDSSTGTEQWRALHEGTNNALITDGALVLNDSRLRSFDLDDGSERWSTVGTSPELAASDGVIVTHSDDVRAVDASTGAVNWTERPTGTGRLNEALSIGAGAVYSLGGFSGELGAFDLVTGEQLWLIQHDTAFDGLVPAVIQAGVLVAVEADGTIVAFR